MVFKNCYLTGRVVTTSPELFFAENPNFPDDVPCTLKALGAQLKNSRLQGAFTRLQEDSRLEALVSLFINVEALLAKWSNTKSRSRKKDRLDARSLHNPQRLAYDSKAGDRTKTPLREADKIESWISQ